MPPRKPAAEAETAPVEPTAPAPDGESPPPAPEKRQPPPAGAKLATKLAWIMGEMRHVPKAGFNQAQKYSFVKESDVAEKVSQLLAEMGIWINQTVISHKRKPLYQTQSGLTMWLSTVWVEYYFIDGETGDQTPARMFPGTGADTGDKGLYKALTGSEKYFLMKSFLVSTGDDPEADEKVDRQAAAASAGSTGVRVTRGRQAGVERGGRSNVATAVQVGEVARLARTMGLDADTVVPVLEGIVGEKLTDGRTIREWLGGMTGQQVAEIVTVLTERAQAVAEVMAEAATVAAEQAATVDGTTDSSTEMSTEPANVDETEGEATIEIV